MSSFLYKNNSIVYTYLLRKMTTTQQNTFNQTLITLHRRTDHQIVILISDTGFCQ